MIYDHVCHPQHDGWQGLSLVRSKVLLWSFLLPVSWFVSSRMWKDLFCSFFYFALDPPFSLKLYNLHKTTWTHRLRSGLFIANVDASTLPAGRHASLCIVQDFHTNYFCYFHVFLFSFTDSCNNFLHHDTMFEAFGWALDLMEIWSWYLCSCDFTKYLLETQGRCNGR